MSSSKAYQSSDQTPQNLPSRLETPKPQQLLLTAIYMWGRSSLLIDLDPRSLRDCIYNVHFESCFPRDLSTYVEIKPHTCSHTPRVQGLPHYFEGTLASNRGLLRSLVPLREFDLCLQDTGSANISVR